MGSHSISSTGPWTTEPSSTPRQAWKRTYSEESGLSCGPSRAAASAPMRARAIRSTVWLSSSERVAMNVPVAAAARPARSTIAMLTATSTRIVKATSTSTSVYPERLRAGLIG